MTLARRQVRLRRRSTNAPQGGDERQADGARKIFCLIESALAPSGRMKRNGDGKIGLGQHIGTAYLHQRAKRLCQRSTTVVLEGVNDRAQRAVVSPDGT